MKTLLSSIGCLLFATGCTTTSSQTSGVPQAANVKVAQPLAQEMVVRRAHLPIEYQISGRQMVRVDDQTTGKHIWQHRVEGYTQLRVSNDGIRVNTKRIYSRKLKNRDLYEIVFLRQ